MREPYRYKQRGSYEQKLDLGRCRAAVHNDFGVGFRQCSNSHKPDSDWCGVHNPEAATARARKNEAKRLDRERRDPLNKAFRRSAAYRELRPALDALIEKLRGNRDYYDDPLVLDVVQILESHGDDPGVVL